MINLLQQDRISDNLLASLQSRDVALWIHSLPNDGPTAVQLAEFLKLPWQRAFLEHYDDALLTALESNDNEMMIRRRGHVHVVDNDPSRIQLPPRSLPIYLLNGRAAAPGSLFEQRLRRMTMQEELRRSTARHLLVITNDGKIPDEVAELWSSGFRPYITFISGAVDALDAVRSWTEGAPVGPPSALLGMPIASAVAEIVFRYSESYPETRQVIRLRDSAGQLKRLDVTNADDPERPITGNYELIEERDLTPLTPEELSEADFASFFQGSPESWRPYAAGLPWERDSSLTPRMIRLMQRLDSVGPSGNAIAYIASESGAGGTTLARTLAWELARAGYPVLLAKNLPFTPDALPVTNYLARVAQAVRDIDPTLNEEAQTSEKITRRYETPWVLVFDRLHWEYRDSELRRFRNELEKSGRPVCILVVAGPIKEMAYYDSSTFTEIARLTHNLDGDEAINLGRHLNRYLRVYGKERPDWQWQGFHESHTVRYVEGIAAFWITLSFWIQSQFDLSDSIQDWIYKLFKAKVDDPILRLALIEVAALSSARLPLPEGLLPTSGDAWPVGILLDDRRSDLSPLGLVRVSSGGEKYWALVSDLLGRFLLNALFYDFPMRKDLGLEAARSAEHLRFLILSSIATKSALGEIGYRALGEEFATSVFKIDPDHGRAAFAPMWREVLNALSNMPQPLRDGSRVFRHHTAVSRRRIAKLDELAFGVSPSDRLELLERAIQDIEYAIRSIDYSPGSESDLNLYNSLANAYIDLADVEAAQGATAERVAALRRAADDATRKAYEESPTNSYVIETYVKNLLETARISPDLAISSCIEALEIVYSAMSTDDRGLRRMQLSDLADRALNLLLSQPASNISNDEPAGPIDVLLRTWLILGRAKAEGSEGDLISLPHQVLLRAIDELSHPAGQGNGQVLRLSYQLLTVAEPFAFQRQIDQLGLLDVAGGRLTPQLRLELALLQYQVGRFAEGDDAFRRLRNLWRDSEHFVRVPDRLRWLHDGDSEGVRTVHAIAASDQGQRSMGRVREFDNISVPYRLEEFDVREHRPGTGFSALVSFGHNGPLLRPLTARTSQRN